MEESILQNVDLVIDNFNELLITQINKTKQQLINEFKIQIKNDVIKKLDNLDITYTNNITLDDVTTTICKHIKDNDDSYINTNRISNLIYFLKKLLFLKNK